MDQLVAGYRRFRATTWREERDRFAALAEGQQPHTLIIACSDSRVDPQRIFGAAPGELFVVRNVANLVPPYAPDSAYHGTSAALEFAVRVLQVRAVVVMGHAACGGIRAVLEGVPDGARDFVKPWISLAAPMRERVLRCEPVEARQRLAEEEAIKLSLGNLMTFPFVREAVEAGRLALHGAHFGIADGVLSMLRDGAFAPIRETA